MSSTVVRDISDTTAGADRPGAGDTARPEAEPAPTVRRFSFDPASSPVLMAALAWDTERLRR